MRKLISWCTFLVFFLLLQLTACSDKRSESSSPDVTAVLQSAVKRQSIGNCWLYASASWLESLYYHTHNEEINVSESYWTWWHWYEAIVNSRVTELNTAGTWQTAMNILRKHGYILEGEFIPSEATTEMSERQLAAKAIIEKALKKGGDLENDRTPEHVRKVLDKAFTTDMAVAETKVRLAKDTMLMIPGEDILYDLPTMITKWRTLRFPQVNDAESIPNKRQTQIRNLILNRVKIALNQRIPVVMSLMIDFNALDTKDSTFKLSKLKEKGQMGNQGGHLVVLEDYVVDNVPNIGFIGEGDVEPELKEAALSGDIVYFKAKNSWGTNRVDRGLIDGYSRFDWQYLTSQLQWKIDDDEDNTAFYTTLQSFIIPNI